MKKNVPASKTTDELRKIALILIVAGVILAIVAFQNNLIPNMGKATQIAIGGRSSPSSSQAVVAPDFLKISVISQMTDVAYQNYLTEFFYSPPILDIDNDSQKDIVASSTGGIYAWKNNGASLPGWPSQLILPAQFYFTPSLADIDNDGDSEIFGGAETSNQVGLSHSGNPLPGWPQQAAGNYFNGPSAIADLDNDGDLEIVNGTKDQVQYYPAKVYVWNDDGSVLTGWPQSVGEILVRGHALADMDSDGTKEIIAVDGRKVFAWNHNGTALSQWPLAPQPDNQIFSGQYGGTYFNSPLAVAAGDVDNDGSLNIVVMTYNSAYYEPHKRIWIHAFNMNGTELPNFPVEISGLNAEIRPGIVLADLDNDQLLEIIVTTTKAFVIVKSSGTIQNIPSTNFPATYSQLFGAVVANIDNDTQMEIIAPVWMDNTSFTPYDAFGAIYAWNHNGSSVSGFPIRLPVIPTSGISIANIDNDPKIEVIGGWAEYDPTGTLTNDIIDSGVYIQDLPTQYSLGQIEWETYGHDIRHTNTHP